MKIIPWLSFYLISLFLFVIYPLETLAQESNQEPMNGFSYQVIQPENQLNKDVGYYDLLMKQGQKQKVELILYNTTKKAFDVSTKLSGAKTNGNGIVEYAPNDLKEDGSLKYKFTDIVKTSDRVTVPAEGNKTVIVDITMPEDSVEGLIAGGIQLQLIEEGQNTEKEIIQNKFAYLIGFLLSESDTTAIKPNLKFNEVYSKVSDGQHTLFLNYSNTRPIFVENMDVAVKVFKNNLNKELFEIKKSELRMAPNSMIDFPISLDDKKLVKGEYKVQADVRLPTGENWKWERNFTVTQEDLSTLSAQKNQMNVDATNPIYKVLLGVIVVVILVLVMVIILIKRIKSKTQRLS
ncbi:DUF916 and DUF3324 domain-containing protein [Enterococcus plantarum]|uniref:DUF916 and DUF3324 domain-containing protein n=1 Tax=Enterococcus plantarum TaxID=1077675 RepID=UPI001A8FBDDA|nr:DUF916 and DUF3324 domain-containing protein [Enterococcus plantarum]MBO0468674.1 DUF916 and DUF3324 domain-containing protein [Enterococcus plantarum]